MDLTATSLSETFSQYFEVLSSRPRRDACIFEVNQVLLCIDQFKIVIKLDYPFRLKFDGFEI